MEILPAVDIRGGQCVRLFQGDYDKETVYGRDPAAMAAKWQSLGARWLHLVDLDGAREGMPVNGAAVRAAAEKLTVPFEIGGGIRTIEAAQAYLDLGAGRIIIGTAAVKDPDFAAEVCRRFPQKVIFSIDARNGLVALDGWLDDTGKPAVELARELAANSPAAFIYTDINRDGAQTGVNVEAAAELCRATDVPVIIAAGVSTIDDIKACLPLAKEGLFGVITGRAIYEGTLDLTEAVKLAATV